MRTKLPLLFFFLVLCGITAGAQEPPGPTFNQKLGTVSFHISCPTAEQQTFEHAVALLHSFWFDEAYKQFEVITKRDPRCAIAYWGEAMSLYRQLWSRPDESDLNRGWELIQKAQATGAKTQRERGYVDALAVFYRDHDKSDYDVRTTAYSHAMEKLHQQYPDDHEAAIFYALSLLTWPADDDDPLANPRKAIAVLDPLFAEDPDHPGIAHYLIHAADDPRLAQLGLPAARRYAKIAPGSPHAVHMPSHIFARLGLWQEDIQSNLAAIATVRQMSSMHAGAEHQIHAMDFLEYAYLQIGEDSQAKSMVEGLASIREQDISAGLEGYLDRMRAHFPAMYALETHRWKDALALQPMVSAGTEARAITFWARAVAAGHLRSVLAARDAVNQYEAALEATKKGKYAYRASMMLTNRDEARAWLAFAEGKNQDALKLMRAVADQQDREGKGEVELPAREMLADMLLETNLPHEALGEYEQSMRIDPNRFNGLYGAARASESTGEPTKAAADYTQLLKNCANGAHSIRPELNHAKAFLGSTLR